MYWCSLFNLKCDDVSPVWDITPSCDNQCGSCKWRVEVEKDSKQSDDIKEQPLAESKTDFWGYDIPF